MALILFLLVIPIKGFSQFSAGDGTENAPYQISNAAQLDSTRYFLEDHFILTEDIDLDVAPFNTGEGWEPIGFLGENSIRFGGSFDGNGYTISGLYINKPNSRSVGLFGYTSSASFTKVVLLNINVIGNEHVGGLVGFADFTSIDSSSIDGAVKGNQNIGGLVGSLINRTSIISNSSFEGEVIGNNRTGGIAGSLSSNTTLASSFATGKVDGIEYTGGLVGYTSQAIISNSNHSEGAIIGTGSDTGGLIGFNSRTTIIESFVTSKVTGIEYTGGLVGRTSGFDEETSKIISSYATGEVTGQQKTGGLVGYNTSGFVIDSSYYSGTVTGEEATGGLVGWNEDSFIYNSNAKGAITGVNPENGLGILTGGLVGDNTNSTIHNSFAESVVTGYDFTGAIVVGESLTGGLTGRSAFMSVIDSSYFSGNVNGSGLTGGLVGSNYESTILNSSANSEIIGRNESGGLVGKSENSTIERSSSTGSVNAEAIHTGGLIGFAKNTFITQSYSSSSVESDDERIGGFIGYSDNSTITNSYSVGSIFGNSGVGGFIGENTNSSIVNSYSASPLVGKDSFGGFIGVFNSGEIESSYWNVDVSTLIGIPNDDVIGLTGLTSLEMSQDSSFKDWDFMEIWNLDEGTFPWLKNNPQDPLPVAQNGNGLFAGGLGTPDNPWQIATASQLDSIRLFLNKHFVLVGDIELDQKPYNSGEGWKPIGDESNPISSRFTGSFDGSGFKISGLFINRPDSNQIGFFGFSREANFKRIVLDGVTIIGNRYAGGLAGTVSGGSIIEVYISGSISGDEVVGGLVGEIGDSTVVSQSHSVDVKIEGSTYIGGLVGYANEGAIIKLSSSKGEVIGTESGIGGLLGQLDYGSRISESFSNGKVTGQIQVGGLVGSNRGGLITNNYSRSTVSTNNNGQDIGGFVGYNATFTFTNEIAEITNNYYSGRITNESNNAKSFLGEFVSGILKSNYWNIDSTSISLGANGYSGSGIKGLTTSEMLDEASFTDWDFDNIWVMEGNTFPSLRNNPPVLSIDSVSVSVDEGIEPITDFELMQNYPNPFNPTTNISFLVPETGVVNLTVYNLLGQKVATLVSKKMPVGRHTISFDASRLSSGIYIYKLKQYDKIGIKKMILIK
ncbi:MAG: hypothetical protein CL670_09815 [Balneola sp.]|nr:hypothetical protein [Balneola sp.]MBE79439.1 hypothetical protein [Balneola sp.]